MGKNDAISGLIVTTLIVGLFAGLYYIAPEPQTPPPPKKRGDVVASYNIVGAGNRDNFYGGLVIPIGFFNGHRTYCIYYKNDDFVRYYEVKAKATRIIYSDSTILEQIYRNGYILRIPRNTIFQELTKEP